MPDWLEQRWRRQREGVIDRTVSEVEYQNAMREAPPPRPTRCTKPDCYGLLPQVLGGPHWHEVRDDGTDAGVNPWHDGRTTVAPKPVAAPSMLRTLAPTPRERCKGCADLLPAYRSIPWCVRCNKVRLQAAQAARKQAQTQVVRPPKVYHCLACRTNIPDPGQGPRLCSRCVEERYVEQPTDDDAGLRRTTGTWPHLAFYTNHQGESVVNGRVLPHPRYGESRMDRFGDTPEFDDF